MVNTFTLKILSGEEPGRLQSMGSLKVRHNWATSLSLFTFVHWRRKWQPTPVFLPGESQGQGSCRLWGRTELDTTKATWQQSNETTHFPPLTLFTLRWPLASLATMTGPQAQPCPSRKSSPIRKKNTYAFEEHTALLQRGDQQSLCPWGLPKLLNMWLHIQSQQKTHHCHKVQMSSTLHVWVRNGKPDTHYHPLHTQVTHIHSSKSRWLTLVSLK